MSAEYLTVEEFATEYRLSESAVYRALREGRLEGVQVLGRWRIPRSACPVAGRRPQSAESDPMPNPRRRPPAGSFRAKVVELRGARG